MPLRMPSLRPTPAPRDRLLTARSAVQSVHRATVGGPVMTSPIITEAVRALVERRDLTAHRGGGGRWKPSCRGRPPSAQIAAFLTALRMKGETVGGADRLRPGDAAEGGPRAHAGRRGGRAHRHRPRDARRHVRHRRRRGKGSLNVSTAAAVVVAAAGLPVAKHGNRSMSGLTASSLCGSADVRRDAWGQPRSHPGRRSAAASTRPASASCTRRCCTRP